MLYTSLDIGWSVAIVRYKFTITNIITHIYQFPIYVVHRQCLGIRYRHGSNLDSPITFHITDHQIKHEFGFPAPIGTKLIQKTTA